MQMDSDLAAIHGYLCADGYVIKNPKRQKQKYYRIGFRNTNLLLLKDFQEKFEKVFGIRPRLVKKERCEKGSKEIYEVLTQEFGSFYSWEWKMPTDLDKKCAAAWLRACFDCEGWVQARKAKSRSVSMESVNYKGILQIQKELREKFDIQSKVRKRKTRTTCALDIFGKENICRFKERIGFLHDAKQKKLDEAIASYIDYYWNFPEQNLKTYLKNLMLEKATVKRPRTIRITSIIKENLDELSKHLLELYRITSKVYGPWKNNSGTNYYEIYIYDKASRESLIKLSLLSNEQINKLKGD